MEQGKSPWLRYAFFGHFSALIASIYGHRPGVFINMSVTEVLEAKEEEEEEVIDGDADPSARLCDRRIARLMCHDMTTKGGLPVVFCV